MSILAIKAFKNESIDPLDLILAIKIATNDFIDAHKDAEGKSFEDTTAGQKTLLHGSTPST